MKSGTTKELISHDRAWSVEVMHSTSDPSAWYVVQKKKYFLFKRRTLERYFINEAQALEFAEELNRTKDDLVPQL
jgi:polysaccharide pyruvyl transferase WcaK-like protein